MEFIVATSVPPVALDLLQVLSLVTQQAPEFLVAGQDVNRAPEVGPSLKAHSFMYVAIRPVAVFAVAMRCPPMAADLKVSSATATFK